MSFFHDGTPLHTDRNGGTFQLFFWWQRNVAACHNVRADVLTVLCCVESQPVPTSKLSLLTADVRHGDPPTQK